MWPQHSQWAAGLCLKLSFSSVDRHWLLMCFECVTLETGPRKVFFYLCGKCVGPSTSGMILLDKYSHCRRLNLTWTWFCNPHQDVLQQQLPLWDHGLCLYLLALCQNTLEISRPLKGQNIYLVHDSFFTFNFEIFFVAFLLFLLYILDSSCICGRE